METLKQHDFLAHEQRKYLQQLKDFLPMDEVIVLMDFAENYRVHIQNEVQGFHWTNIEATVHPFVIYYRDNYGNLKHLNFVVISDCLKPSPKGNVKIYEGELTTCEESALLQ